MNNHRFSFTNRGNYRGRYTNRGRWQSKSNRSHTNTPSSSRDTSSVNSDALSAIRKTAEQPLISVVLDVIPGPYPGWKLYFPQEGYASGSPTVNKIRAMESHIARRKPVYILPRCRKLMWYAVHLQVLLGDVLFSDEWPMLQEDLSERPEHTLNCLGLAMHQVLSKEVRSSQTQNHPDEAVLGLVRARVFGHGPITPLKSIKVNAYGKLVSIRGTVIRAGNPKLLCTWLTYSCNMCMTQQAVKQPAGVMTMPEKCLGTECLARSHFTPMLDSSNTQTVAWQTLRIQELKTGDQFELGRVPRTVEVEVTADLVDSCCPGDEITVTGIVQVRALDDNSKRDHASMYKLYLEGISIQNQREQPRDDELTEKDHEAITAIRSEPELFRLLVHSLCPLIFGRETVKAGLLLALFGGSAKRRSDGDGGGGGTRQEAHVLVVGDPGLGKSQILQACAHVAPRGVFVCGNTSSAAGLTVSVGHDGSHGSGLEAGALVLADRGVCCIDEFDKMTKQHHQALLEAMEQQCISVAKAGVVCTLPARCAVLAAANPAGGVYNRAKTVAENVKLDPALLSRFDLVFILLDTPDEQLDHRVSEHIFAMHSSSSRESAGGKSSAAAVNLSATQRALLTEASLHERLKLRPGEVLEHLPHSLMRKYIGYARKNVHPKLSPEAAEELKKFYLDLRKVRQGSDSTPVTTRQLEALIRLTMARARLELKSTASLDHARDVLDIMRHSMVDVFSDGLGLVDFGRGQNGSGMSQNSRAKRYISLLQKHAQISSRSLFTHSELREFARAAGLLQGAGGDFNVLLESLNLQGYLLKKGSQTYQLLGAANF